MAHSLQVTVSAALNGASVSAGSATASGSAALDIDEVFADDAVNAEIACAIDVSALKGLYILSSVDATLETNDGTSPDDTLDLAGGVPFVWVAGGGVANPLGTDVVSIFVTNDGAAEGSLRLIAITDATP